MKDITIIDLGHQFGLGVNQLFDPWFCRVMYPEGIKGFEKALASVGDDQALVVFGGGEDINPELYGHNNYGSYTGQGLSFRDKLEKFYFNEVKKAKLPMLGICRGAQFLCAMTGGALVQHADGHLGNHLLSTFDSKDVVMSSAHHQMMIPNPTSKYQLLAWTKNLTGGGVSYDSRRLNRLLEGEQFFDKEPEIVYFEEVNALAVQGHPEFMSPQSDAAQYTRDLIKKFLFKG